MSAKKVAISTAVIYLAILFSVMSIANIITDGAYRNAGKAPVGPRDNLLLGTTEHVDGAAVSNLVFITPTTGKKIIINSILVSANAANDIKILDSDGSLILPWLYCRAKGGLNRDLRDPIRGPLEIDDTINLTASTTQSFSVSIGYWEE